ncbi:MAG: glutamate-5-semialdehyde dehydrogenase [Phycisphaeraceae bacterium]|nr:glutamate-5-semialdehyde dehydrogenase [Phycisphaeraceae bacterium]
MPSMTDSAAYSRSLTDAAVAASRSLASVPGKLRDDALHRIADELTGSIKKLQDANAIDLEEAKKEALPGAGAMLDRLTLTDKRIADMAAGVRQIADQPDPVGKVIEGRVLANGLKLQKLRVPIGVILIIFESRPNVTSDAAALCIKSGNAVILRGGKEAMRSNAAVATCVQRGLNKAGLDPRIVQLVESPDRTIVGELLKQTGRIDLCIPRGGESLIRAVVEQARIPVIKHYTGNCHTYRDADCDDEMALNIAVNAKAQRPGVCNATETFLIHKDAAGRGLLLRLCKKLAEHKVEIRGDEITCKLYPQAKPAVDADWDTEYLDLIVAMRVVDSLKQAIDHINVHGSKHTDAIVTRNLAAAEAFVQQVDTACAFVNCSTRFSDGGQFGLGAEIGISTDKLHARGPMGAEDLTTYKWVAYGDGQIRG